MSIVSLAIVGKDNEPLFLREYNALEVGEDALDQERPVAVKGENDVFFSADFGKGGEASLRHQFIIHSALDRFEEIAGPSSGNQWRSPGAVGSDAMWVGLLCPVEDLRVYGYLTNTNIKLMCVVEDSDEMGVGQFQQTREAELRSFFATVHDHYVEYTLNPFSKLKSPIVSPRFAKAVWTLVQNFNGKKAS